MISHHHENYEVAVIGGGLAGLTVAALLARAGRRVVVYERSNTLGGRGSTRNIDGFHFNLGPHALYRGGHAMRVLRELGIEFPEPPVGTSGSTAVKDGRIYPLPVGLGSLLRSPLLTFSGRFELARFLATIPTAKVQAWDCLTLQQWLDRHIRNAEVRMLIEALIRVATYGNAPAEFSAGAALDQFRTALRYGVTYLNGGWQRLVDRLQSAAVAAGAVIHMDVAVTSLKALRADAFVLAVPPKTAAAILGDQAGPGLLGCIKNMQPVEAACLNLGFRSLPEPSRTFAVGLDQPIYFSVHSRWADLAPEGKVLVQVAKYLPSGGPTNPVKDREEIASFLDLVQPEWWHQVEYESFMPRLTVTYGLVRAADGGLRGRPAVDSALAKNVYIVGDWVGDEGMLGDAALASASRVAQLIVTSQERTLEPQTV